MRAASRSSDRSHGSSGRDRHQTFRVYVVELDDAFGDRASPTKPHVHVGITVTDPRKRIERLRRGTSRIADHAVRLRQDLVRNYRPTKDRADALRQLRKVKRKLKRRGYTVNGDNRAWRVYVFRVEDTVATKKSGNADKPWVYVGLTAIPIEERWLQHRDAKRGKRGQPVHSRKVHGHVGSLMPELYERTGPVFTQEDAQALEKRVADRLRAEGYSVLGGH